MVSKISLSKMSRLALKTMGELIKAGRTERGLSQRNLAERLNASRQTIMAIEKGSPAVAIGIVFEAAIIVGIPLLADNEQALQKLKQSITAYTALLPKRVRSKNGIIDDNF